jgi:FKBP-type peptidyl-prolyl cis-trans isomerase
MKYIKLIALICAASLFFVSCGENKFKGYEKTENGLYYKFFVKNDTGKKAESGDYVFLTISWRGNHDSIKAESQRPIMDVMPPASIFKGDIYEAFAMMHKGDSAEFIIKADSFYSYFLNPGQAALPAYITPETHLYFNVKMNEIKSLDDFDREEKIQIDAYVKTNNITEKPTESGLYYIEKQVGEGKQVQVSDSVLIHYTGKFLNGEIFDSSVERGEPIGMKLNSLIPGFKEGVSLMKEGGKAMFIIPSSLAYGQGGRGMPPFAPLMFEIEVIKILK